MVALHDGDAEAGGARLHDGERLRMNALIDEEDWLLGLALRVDHGHRLGGGGGLVEERGVAQLEARHVHHHRLVGHEALEATLRDFGLVRGVLRVPSGVLEHVAQDDGGGLRVIVALSEEGAVDDVLRGDALELCQGIRLGETRGVLLEIELAAEADGVGDGLVDELGDGRHANRLQHRRDVGLARPIVARLKAVERGERRSALATDVPRERASAAAQQRA
mmetsp:Transcript_30066/g.77914  ORF Transcript_30066/g.77914 Transcript_30066/m.77914 type:complete len:221 (-) Transcript_30066:69-731(-)